MTTRRVSYVVLFLFTVASFAGLAYLWLESHLTTSRQSVRVYKPDQSDPLYRPRTMVMEDHLVIIDRETESRQDQFGQRIYNPVVLNDFRLRQEYGGTSTAQAFRRGYVRYYEAIYELRLDQTIKPEDREVDLALEYWRRSTP